MSVCIDATKTLSVISPLALGVHILAAGEETDPRQPVVVDLLRQAGVTAVRYPGGTFSDEYHWASNTFNPPEKCCYAPRWAQFDRFMTGFVQAVGAQVIVTVNYGSNAAASGGGDPAEAAAWVRHANTEKHYGVHFWEIGNEVYGNGFYGPKWETDLHSSHDPETYGANALLYVTAMKQVDPSIQVGIALGRPGEVTDGPPAWNPAVLKSIQCRMDFVALHFYPQGPGHENDAVLLDSTMRIANDVRTVHDQIMGACGQRGSSIKILVTETNSVSDRPGNQTTSIVNALFLVEDYLAWLQSGAYTVEWHDLYSYINLGNDVAVHPSYGFGDYGLLSRGVSLGGKTEPPANTPFPAYYGLVLLHRALRPGDAIVAVEEQPSGPVAYAVRRQDGAALSVVLINADPALEAAVAIHLVGFTAGGSVQIARYGPQTSAIAVSEVAPSGETTTVSLPPYSASVVVFTASS
ncbi:MAG TPA: hypothetical protein VGZ22_21505 [Isosphaeraceae bacterium]|nr:hypothetical protein [Isosphaeraceae bacterium]